MPSKSVCLLPPFDLPVQGFILGTSATLEREAKMRRSFNAIFATFLGAQGLCVTTDKTRAQQAYPTKPIQFVVTTAAEEPMTLSHGPWAIGSRSCCNSR